MKTLAKFPDADEFYRTYWGQRPFVVKNAIDKDVIKTLIDGDTLAGLSLEDDIKSRIIITANQDKNWTCEHGPFDEDKFSTLGEKNWSLLVQNVEQCHLGTANLLKAFHFSPRWLMDDIMVSYSTAGGSVGPHTDSYHVFIVQGIGKRQWTVGHTLVQNQDCVEGLDLKVLKEAVDGTKVKVSIGDVIYIPPNFAHEGVTIEEAMSFSVGFLGPKLSELLVEYGHYLETVEDKSSRYSGQNLSMDNAAFHLAPQEQKTLQNKLSSIIQSNDFSEWLAEYFSTPTHDDIENIEPREEIISSSELLARLQEGHTLYRPEHIKLSITTSLNGSLNLAAYGKKIPTAKEHEGLINWLNKNRSISIQDIDHLGEWEILAQLMTRLHNQNVLFFENEDFNRA